MPKRKTLAQVTYITDHDTGMYHIGEVEGGFQEGELSDFIEKHGREELLSTLSYMTYQVVHSSRELNAQRSNQGVVRNLTPPTNSSDTAEN